MDGTAQPHGSAPTGNIWIRGLLWGTEWASGRGTTVVTTYIAGRPGGEVVSDGVGGSVTAYEPYAREVAAIHQAMATFEAVCNLDFRSSGTQAGADVVWSIVGGVDAPGSSGWAIPPGLGSVDGKARSLIALNYEAFDPAAGAAIFTPGGLNFSTLVHELGHAVGLAHPHDHGGGSAVFPGVGRPFGDLGAFDMNQGVYTMMSYNDGWWTGPRGPSPSPMHGLQAGPMALDIAALQHMYGANLATRTGDDGYRLPGANALGTAYRCLWDAGGDDRILGASDRANAIDLRAATLAAGPGGAGFLSYAQDVHGGFTIAHGVVIEDARGGRLADHLHGNAAANRLEGRAGDDRLLGGLGHDELSGGAGSDRLHGGSGGDRLSGEAGADRLVGGLGADAFVFRSAAASVAGPGCDRVADFARGLDRIDLAAVDADRGAAGDQAFRIDLDGHFAAGEIRQVAQGGALLLELNLDADPRAEMAILVLGSGPALTAGDFLL